MCIKSPVSLPDQAFIEFGLVRNSRFVTSNKHYRGALGVKSKGNSPNATVRVEAELLHIGVLRPVEGVNPRQLSGRTELFDHPKLGQKLVLNLDGQFIELFVKLVGELNVPHSTTE